MISNRYVAKLTTHIFFELMINGMEIDAEDDIRAVRKSGLSLSLKEGERQATGNLIMFPSTVLAYRTFCDDGNVL